MRLVSKNELNYNFLIHISSGWLPAVAGLPWSTEYAGSNIIGGVKPEEFDVFHELILVDEVSRCGSGGKSFNLLRHI